MISVILVASFAIPVISGTINSTDAPIGNPEDGNPDNDLYVFILAGQSQSVYRNYDLTIANENAKVRDGQAFYYGNTAPIVYNSSWPTWNLSTLGIHSMNNADGSWKVGSMEAPIASTFVNATGKSILIINVGINGRNIESFVNDQEGYRYATTMVEDALSKIDPSYNVHYGGVFWLHGQANLLGTKEHYIREFGKVYNQYKEMGFGTFIIEQPRASEAPTIDAANVEICKTFPNCYIGSTAGTNYFVNGGPYVSADGTHYNQLGRNIVGKELASCYVNEVNRELAWKETLPSSTVSLLNVIPFLLLAGMITGTVAMFILRRD